MDSTEKIADKLQQIMENQTALERFLRGLSVDPGNILTRDATMSEACWQVARWALSKYQFSNLLFALRGDSTYENVPLDDLQDLLILESRFTLDKDAREALKRTIDALGRKKVRASVEELSRSSGKHLVNACFERPNWLIDSLNYLETVRDFVDLSSVSGELSPDERRCILQCFENKPHSSVAIVGSQYISRWYSIVGVSTAVAALTTVTAEWWTIFPVSALSLVLGGSVAICFLFISLGTRAIVKPQVSFGTHLVLGMVGISLGLLIASLFLGIGINELRRLF